MRRWKPLERRTTSPNSRANNGVPGGTPLTAGCHRLSEVGQALPAVDWHSRGGRQRAPAGVPRDSTL
jgi:hypothetical protein